MRGTERAARRLLVAVSVSAVATVLFAEPALAQLPSVTQQTPSQPVAQVTQPVTQTAAPVVQQVAQPVAQVTQPVTQTAAPVVQAATTPVTQTLIPPLQQTAPMIQQATAPATAAIEPVTEAAAPVLEAAQPVVDAAAPLLQATQPLVSEATAPVGGVTAPLVRTSSSLLHTTAPAVGASGPRVAAAPVLDTVPHLATAQPTSTGATSFVATAGDSASRRSAPTVAPDRSRLERAGRPVVFLPQETPVGSVSPTPPRVVASADVHKASVAKSPPNRPDTPSAPRGPLGFLAVVSAAFGSTAGLVFVAALAAAVLLAAPGLSRRLRLGLAPWPLPIALPSLERPG